MPMPKSEVSLSVAGDEIWSGSHEEFQALPDRIGRVNPGTGELRQPTLDDAMFEPYQVQLVRVNISGGVEMLREELTAYLDGAELDPDLDIEVRFIGRIVGAGLKWAPDGTPKGANVNIHLETLGALEVKGEENAA